MTTTGVPFQKDGVEGGEYNSIAGYMTVYEYYAYMVVLRTNMKRPVCQMVLPLPEVGWGQPTSQHVVQELSW